MRMISCRPALLRCADSCDVALMAAGSLGGLVAGGALPMAAYMFGHALDALAWANDPQRQFHRMCQSALHASVAGLLAAIGYFLQVSCWHATGERQAHRMRYLYMQALLRQEVAFFDRDISSGAVLHSMAADTFHIKRAAGDKLGKLVHILGALIFGFGVAFWQGWKLTLLISAIIPFFVACAYAIDAATIRTSRRLHAVNAAASSVVEQSITGIRTLLSFGGEKKALEAYDNALRGAHRAGFYQSMASGVGMAMIAFMTYSTYALALWFGGDLVVHGDYRGGRVLTVLFSVMIGTGALAQCTPSLTAIACGTQAARKMFQVIDHIPSISHDNGQILTKLTGKLEFKNLYFAYPTRPEYEVLSSFNLSIAAGTTCALVGKSGSGKSTIASLIERFYDPLSGNILVDGIDLKILNLGWLRNQIGLVSQEPALLAASIRDNVAYGRNDASDEEIQVAINLAQAATFVKDLPNGLDTIVGQRGIQLSGGQKQRIAIARAILKDPRILILDEATSSLDVESMGLVQMALDNIRVNRTTLIITHDIANLRSVDLIAVIHHGQVIEQGSHDELLQKPNSFYSQLLNIEDAEEKGHLLNVEMQHSPASTKSSSPEQWKRYNSSSSFNSSDSISINSNNGTQQNKDKHPEEANQVDSDVEEMTTMRSQFLRLVAYNKQEFPILLLGSIAAGVNGAIMPIVGLLFANVVHTFYNPPDQIRSDSIQWIYLFIVVGCIAMVLTPFQTMCFSTAGEKLVHRIRLSTFSRVLQQEIVWFENSENPSGLISSRLLRDASHMKSMVGDTLGLVVQNLTTVIVGLFIAISSCWQLALLFLALLPAYGLDAFVQIKQNEVFDSKAKVVSEETSQVAHEALCNIRTVVSYCGQEKVLSCYAAKSKNCVRTSIHQALLGGLGMAVTYLLMFGSFALFLWVGGHLVVTGNTTFYRFLKTFLTIELSAFAISLSMAVAPDISNVKQAMSSIFSMLDLEHKDPTSGIVTEMLKGEVEFQKVQFAYPLRPTQQVLCGLSFSLQAGKTIAIVGESGCGKSTILALMQKFYEPNHGNILLDRVDISRFNTKWLRSQIAVVNQEPFLFNDTIRANIEYGLEREISEEEVYNASMIANANKFISSLPSGYQTIVGERGTQLSGGQKQRIAIARAIVRNPAILLLDEATSALDAEDELLVQEALEMAAVGRSTMVVAHRLSTIRGADLIIVLKNGCVAERGTHDELMAFENGHYTGLVRMSTTSKLF